MNIAGYTIGFQLGSGSDGNCYMATREDKEYCLKIVTIKKEEETKRNRILMEIEALKRLNFHDNIITYYDSFRIRCGNNNNIEKFCICTEILPMNLNDYMMRNAYKLSEVKTKKIGKQIIKALAWMHKNLIVHNDIKFENITIDPKSMKVKMIDFGMSVVCKNESEIKSLKKIHGTPYYLSPEKFQKKDYDGRKSDAWATGVILYRMITGNFPFDNKQNDLYALARSVCFDSYVAPKCSQHLTSLISLLMIKEPEDRLSMQGAMCHPFFMKKKFVSKSVDSILVSPQHLQQISIM